MTLHDALQQTRTKQLSSIVTLLDIPQNTTEYALKSIYVVNIFLKGFCNSSELQI